MASSLPPVKGSAFTFYTSLVSVADTDNFQDNPTLAAGDVVVIKDGVLDGNIDALPVAVTSATRVLAVTLSAAEMNADVVTVIFTDADGDQWQGQVATIYTVAQTFDTTDAAVDAIAAKVIGTLAAGTHNAQSGDAYAIVNHATYGNSALNTDIDAILADTGTDGVVLKAAGLAADAAAEIADAVWDELISGHTTAGSMADELSDVDEDVWGYTTRTLTAAAATTTATVSGTTITAVRGDTLSATLTSLGSIAGRTKLWFTVKEEQEDADTAAIVQIEETDGLKYINGAAATASNGSLVVNNETTGSVTITVKPADTDDLAVGRYKYDMQWLTSAGVVTTLTSGVFEVTADITRAVA